MKRILLSALIGVGMVAAILQIPSESKAARTAADYPLVCRGGATVATSIALEEGKLGFNFIHGTKPATDGLDAGECSWVDRKMYDAEPYRVSESTEEVVGAPKPGWYGELRSSDKYWTFMVSNNGKGQLIATSARPNAPFDISPTATTTIAAASDRVRTFNNHQLLNDCKKFDPFPSFDEPSPGTNLVGYINHWSEGGFLGCTTQFNSAFRGTVWFDLSEILSKPGLPKATKATLTFKKILSVANDANGKPITRVCDDSLMAASEDWMVGDFDKRTVAGGEFDFNQKLGSCPPEGCSIDVTDVVNSWIVHPETRNGFVISGEDENFLEKLIPKTNDACETRYGDFSLTVNYKYDKTRVPDTYPFECRGADTLKFVEEGSVGTRQVGFTFISGSGSARDGLKPGQCSWLDRAMRAGEPTRLTQPIEGAGWIKELNSSDSYWTFNVYNAGDRLQATAAERSKKFFVPLLRTNFALASNGATANPSTFLPGFEAIGAINGDRAGVNWGSGGGWADATSGVFPDYLEVVFKGSHTIDRINVYTLQDDYKSPKDPGEPSAMMPFTASGFGLTAFEVQVRDGSAWVTIGSVSGSDPKYVGREFNFKAVTTDRIRVVTHAAVDNGYSRITEVEAWGLK